MARVNNNNIILSWDIDKFLLDYPRMALAPLQGSEVILEGILDFTAHYKDFEPITDSYKIQIVIPQNFPLSNLIVFEQDNKIPLESDFHVNPDKSLCLGSPLSLKIKFSQQTSLLLFAQEILVPYLYAISYKLAYGGKLIIDELKHGADGIIEDYKKIFNLGTAFQIRSALLILGTKPRLANKQSCPCGCGKKYCKCNYRFKLEQFRKLANRQWFREQSQILGSLP